MAVTWAIKTHLEIVASGTRALETAAPAHELVKFPQIPIVSNSITSPKLNL